MRAPDEANDELLRLLAHALRDINELLDRPSTTTPVRLDSNIQTMQEMLRGVVTDAKSSAPAWPTADANRLIRAVVVFLSLFKFMLPRLRVVVPRPKPTLARFRSLFRRTVSELWGAHVINGDDFTDIGDRQFEVPLDQSAIARLLADHAADLMEAAEALDKHSTTPWGMLAAIEAGLNRLCGAYGSSIGKRLAFNLLTAAEARVQLNGISDATLQRRRRERSVLSVSTWLGEVRYPSFQFDRGAVKPALSYAARNVSPQLADWALTIFAFEHQDKPEAFFKNVLADRGLWVPDWKEPSSHHFTGTRPPEHRTSVAARMFRVTKQGYSPFYFASYDSASAGSEASGRFDLEAKTKRGTVYLAETPRGAWAEVLGREPVVTLSSLLGRVEWSFAATEEFALADLTTGTVQVSASAVRADTQELAQEIQGTHVGLRYVLRSSSGEKGYALFGPSGATLPGAAQLGAWGSTATSGIHSASLWQYLQHRELHEPAYPVMLRQFPT